MLLPCKLAGVVGSEIRDLLWNRDPTRAEGHAGRQYGSIRIREPGSQGTWGLRFSVRPML